MAMHIINLMLSIPREKTSASLCLFTYCHSGQQERTREFARLHFSLSSRPYLHHPQITLFPCSPKPQPRTSPLPIANLYVSCQGFFYVLSQLLFFEPRWCWLVPRLLAHLNLVITSPLLVTVSTGTILLQYINDHQQAPSSLNRIPYINFYRLRSFYWINV